MTPQNVKSERLIRHVNRQQLSWRAIDVERLIEEDHSARAIRSLVGGLDLRRFYEEIESNAEEGGRPAFDPHPLRGTRSSGYQTISASTHRQNDPSTPQTRLPSRTTKFATRQLGRKVIFDPARHTIRKGGFEIRPFELATHPGSLSSLLTSQHHVPSDQEAR
jgi:hypothetical protein